MFGDYVGRCSPPGFSDCDFTPQPDRYEPIICTFYKDRSGQELWSGDLVRVQHPTAEPSVTVECVIEYSEYDAAFVFVPRENPESTYPLFGMDSELTNEWEVFMKKQSDERGGFRNTLG